MTDGLSAATLAIYIILVIPSVYILVKHGRQGLFGWLFLAIFCTIRIVGSGLSLSNSSAASIISNIGLSPLLFATCGILKEAKTYRLKSLDRRLEAVFDFFFHMLVAAGVILTAIASSKLQHHEQPIEKAERKVKAGMAILTISWVVLVGWTGLAFLAPRRTSPVVRQGTLLLSTVCFSLSFIGVRVIYSLVAMSTQRVDLNPTTGSLAIRVVLSFLPELIAAIAYIAAGMKARDAPKQDREEEAEEWSMAKQTVSPVDA
ncbi:hypothetical protein N8T08_000310 [Aspergillus melleus]|uniref:Uncharacterized protein n=1 Tax=Aspergillus melleus TaxID=138277 RepID=A0ACC3BAV8_9EURO|nr:hypothetical protein N8T08_000310 [Aspergillus melleus]